MKNFIKEHTKLFVAIVAVIAVIVFYVLCYASWAWFYGGDYTFRNEIYNVKMFGSFTMTDKKGVSHTGTLKPMDYSLFRNTGEYVLSDETTGKSYVVMKCSQGDVNYLSYRCPVCDSSYMTQDIKDTQNAGRLNTYGVCLDCIESKNKLLDLCAPDIDPEIFDTSKHIIDDKCDICGGKVFYYDKYEEYCEDHLEALVSSIESIIPHWCDFDDIDISEYSSASKLCFQLGTVKMRDEGYIIELVCPEEGIDYYEYDNRKGEYILEKNKLVQGIKGIEHELIKLLGNGSGKISPTKGSKSEYTVCVNITKPNGEVKQVKLIKRRP